MFSRSMRIAAILVALAQLGVWGFYAPAHRLLHHSGIGVAQTERASGCQSHCCSHHHSHAIPQTDSGHNHSDQCPDDESHCSLCAIALQSGFLADSIGLTGVLARVESVAHPPAPFALPHQVRAFDSRGPPTV